MVQSTAAAVYFSSAAATCPAGAETVLAAVTLLGNTPEVAGGTVSQALAIPVSGMPGHCGDMAGGDCTVSSAYPVAVCNARTLPAAANQPAILVAKAFAGLAMCIILRNMHFVLLPRKREK